MKISQILYKQHIGRMIRRHWYAQGKRTPLNLNTENVLISKGLEVVDPEEILKSKREVFDFEKVNFLKSKPISLDKNHPDWHDRPCLVFQDHELLVEGLAQAQQITKTIVFDTLPENVQALVNKLNVSEEINTLVHRTIASSIIFDAHQDLLPKQKDPNRPAWVFPRQRGITDVRKISNLSKKLIQLCDCLSGPQLASNRKIVENALFCYPIEKEFDQLMFTLTMDVMLVSKQPLKPAGEVKNRDYESMTLPNLYPMVPTVGLRKTNIYKLQNLYPLNSENEYKNVHTVIIYYDKTNVKNITEIETQETQILAKAMMKSFTVAASSAKERFGADVKELPEPISVQCILSDGKRFYFSVYQLNTLDIDGESGLKNYSWISPKLKLYNIGGYKAGKPIMQGYNPEVFKTILAFYKNN